jgi:predicted acyl esterase
MWIPKKAYEGGFRVGTVIEYIPYRTDVTIQRDSIRHSWFAGNGLAAMRIDMRGASASDGVLKDEYLLQEQEDALDAFGWICKQSWSNGNIAMFGKSWAGFNGLQVAARQHPALKTIITLMSTDDRYTDDVHYRGGCLFASDMLWWGSTMGIYAPRPQDPRVVGESWRENWIQRLNTEPMMKNWIQHQTRDEYWKHGSINEDYNQVQIPVLAVGGWRDGYTSPVFRMAENLPHKESCGLIGPWVHEFPEMAEPAPKIGFQQLALKWFKKYLTANDETFNLPKFTAYIQEPCSVKESYTYREGKWVSFSNAAAPTIKSLYIDDNKLVENPTNTSSQVSGVLSHGLFRGTYCPFGFIGDFPADQRVEDSKCAVWDTTIIAEDINLLGEPVMKLKLSCDRKFANVSVRLVDVYPENGENILISWGQLNLTHRYSHEFPEWLTPGKDYDIQIKLDVLGVKLAKGHKLRVAISTCDWPQNWPTPEIPTITIKRGELILPLVNTDSQVPSPVFEQATIMKGIPSEIMKPYDRIKTTEYDYTKDEWTTNDIQDSGCVKMPEFGELSGIYHGSWNKNTFKIKPGDPLSAFNENLWTYEMGREEDGWNIKMESQSTLTADANKFYLVHHLKAFEENEKVFDNKWQYEIERTFQ